MAGGLFANVRLNRLITETLPLDEVFIFPAMGDEGLPVGAALSFLLMASVLILVFLYVRRAGTDDLV